MRRSRRMVHSALVGLGVGGRRSLQQLALDSEADRVRRGVTFAAPAFPLRRREGGEQLATEVAWTDRYAVAHAPLRARRASERSVRRWAAIRASRAYPGRAGRW